MTATVRRACPKHDRYYHVCAACRAGQPAPGRPAVTTALPAPTPVGAPPARPFPSYPENDPRAFPAARPSRLRVRGAVTL